MRPCAMALPVLPVPMAATIMSFSGSMLYFLNIASMVAPSSTMLDVSMTPLVRVWIHSLDGDR